MATKTELHAEMPMEPTTVAACAAVVEAAEANITLWEAEAAKRAAEVTEVEAASVEAALEDADTADGSANRIAVARASADLGRDTLAAARVALLDAQRATFRARADELRTAAEAKREEAAARQVKTDAMLRELEAYEEGAVYLPYGLGIEGYYIGDRAWSIPKTQRVGVEAKDLDHEADVWELRATQGQEGNFPGWVRLAVTESMPPAAEDAEPLEVDTPVLATAAV